MEIQEATANLEAAQNALSRAISLGQEQEAKTLLRKIELLRRKVEEAHVIQEARISRERQVDARQHFLQAEAARKAQEALVDPPPLDQVRQEIANARLTAPLCNWPNCYQRMELLKEMPFVTGQAASWRWICPEHKGNIIQQARSLLYPYRESMNPENFQVAWSNPQPSTEGPRPLMEAQFELARQLAPQCPECGAKMVPDRIPSSYSPGSLMYIYRCNGLGSHRHMPATMQHDVPRLKPPEPAATHQIMTGPTGKPKIRFETPPPPSEDWTQKEPPQTRTRRRRRERIEG